MYVVKKKTRYDKKIRRNIVIRQVETQIDTPETIQQAESEIYNHLNAMENAKHSMQFQESIYQDEKALKEYLETLDKIENYATTIEELVMEIRNKIDGKMQLIEWQKKTGKEPKLLLPTLSLFFCVPN